MLAARTENGRKPQGETLVASPQAVNAREHRIVVADPSEGLRPNCLAKAIGAGPEIKSSFQIELPPYEQTNCFSDLGVTRDRRLPAILGVEIDIVVLAMSFQDTSGFHKLTDKIAVLHTSTSISFSCAGTGGATVCSLIIKL